MIIGVISIYNMAFLLGSGTKASFKKTQNVP